MNTIPQPEKLVYELGRASRRAAAISLLGFLVIIAAMGYAILQLRAMEQQRVSMKTEIQKLRTETESYKRDLTKARASLAAARAAINAFHAGRLEYAVKLYDEALAADPQNAYLQNLRAYSLFKLGRIQAAIEGQRRSLASDPKYAWGYFDLARFLCAASPPRFEDARQAAAKAIELRSDMREIIQGDGEFQRVCQRKVP